jgi:hypothetical protein
MYGVLWVVSKIDVQNSFAERHFVLQRSHVAEVTYLYFCLDVAQRRFPHSCLLSRAMGPSQDPQICLHSQTGFYIPRLSLRSLKHVILRKYLLQSVQGIPSPENTNGGQVISRCISRRISVYYPFDSPYHKFCTRIVLPDISRSPINI